MKVVIVAKTRKGAGACIGAITFDGQSVRLIAADAERNEQAGKEYEIGEVWEGNSTPDLFSTLVATNGKTRTRTALLRTTLRVVFACNRASYCRRQ